MKTDAYAGGGAPVTELRMTPERIEEARRRCQMYELYTGNMQFAAREDILDALHDLRVLHAGIQSLIDSCRYCGGNGERSMVPGGMSKCMGCLPLRDLIYKPSEEKP